MKILAIDTSNYRLGIASGRWREVIGEYITNIKKNHSITGDAGYRDTDEGMRNRSQQI